MNVFDLAASITLDSSGYEKGLSDASKKSESAFGKIMGNAGKLVKTVGKVAITALTAASGAVVAIGKSSIAAYSDYEQYIGGIQTLYKDSADAVIAAANMAFQTTGWSANEYMSTVTTFSAALLKSMGNNTEAAAIMADRAMVDMADNAATFGTDMDRIQAAYAGFAKGNFTMLDNLNLGYAGTEAGMKALIKRANEIRKSQGLTANLTINSFADIVEAVHLVQESMGMYRRAEEEGNKTIAGSYKKMAAAWKNYVGAMADENEYATITTDELVSTVRVFLENNLIPAVERFAVGFVSFIGNIAPYIEKDLPKLIERTLPNLVLAGSKLLVALGKTLPKIAPAILKTGVNGIITVINGLFGTHIPHIKEIRFPTWDEVKAAAVKAWDLIQAGFKSIAKLVLGNDFNADDSWITIGAKIWAKIKQGISDVGDLLASLIVPEGYEFEAGDGWKVIGETLLAKIKEGISSAGDWLAGLLMPEGFVFKAGDGWKVIGENLLGRIQEGITSAGDWLAGLLMPEGFEFTAGDGWKVIGENLLVRIQEGITSAGDWLAGLIMPEGFEFEAGDGWKVIGETILSRIKEGITSAGDWLAGLIMPEGFKFEAGDGWKVIGENILGRIKEGITSAGDWLAGLIMPEGFEFTPGDGWKVIGEVLLSKIKEGITSAGDWLAGLLMPDGFEFEAGDGWKVIGENLLGRIQEGITSAGDWLAGLLMPEGFEFTAGDGWKVIGENILGRIKEGITSAGDWLAGLLLPDGYVFAAGDGWKAIGENILEKIKEGITSAGDWLAERIMPEGFVFTAGDGWKVVGENILSKIKEGITSAGDWLAQALHPDEEISIGTGWDTVGHDIIDGISKAFDDVNDFMLRLFLGKDYAASGKNWGDVGAKIHEAIKNLFNTPFELNDGEMGLFEHLGAMVSDKLQKIFTGSIDGIYGLLLGEAPPQEMELGEKLAGILGGIVDSAFKVLDFGESLIMRLMFGDQREGKDWVDVGNQISEWLNKIFDNAPGENGVGGQIFDNIWDGIEKAASNAGDLLLGLISGGMKKPGTDEAIETWAEYFESIIIAIGDGLSYLLESFFDGAKAKWNDFAEFINKGIGMDLLPKYKLREFDSVTRDVEKMMTEAFKGTQGEKQIDSLLTLFETAKESGFSSDWDKFFAELDKVAEASGIDLSVEGNPLSELLEISSIVSGIEGPHEITFTFNLPTLPGLFSTPIHITKTVDNSPTYGSSSGGQFANGLEYVPTNDYLARLHKGEAVLTASEARAWREGKGGVDTEAIAGAVSNAITEALSGIAFVVNGKQFATAIGGAVGNKISGFQKANSAGYGR